MAQDEEEAEPLLAGSSNARAMDGKDDADKRVEVVDPTTFAAAAAADDEPLKHGDGKALASLANGRRRVALTADDNDRIRWKTDRTILPVLVWVYFLQVIDKTTLGYGAVFGLQKDAGLTGSQYSLVGSIAPIAQLAWQPFSSFLIVKVPPRILMPILVVGWGLAQASMGAAHNFGGLIATRFFLGLFEAGCLPLFSIITSHWYRRAEQPMRVAAWYSMNGIANLTAAALSYGLGQIKTETMYPWQIIFLFCGLLTIASAPIVYWRLDNDIPSARFLEEEEKGQALERLRANQTGTGTREFKWSHVLELALEPKTYLFVGMTLLLNIGAQVSNTFGPLILAGIGFGKYKTTLLNIPFGALQFLTILAGSWAAARGRLKSIVLAVFMLPVVAGIAMLYAIPRGPGHQAPLMVGFYLFAFLFAGNPLIVAWMIGNTAGTTKKSVLMACYQGASSAGNIIGPLLFQSGDAPSYHPGLRAVLAIFIALIALVLIQLANLVFLNRLQERRRVRNGKPAKIKDRSMQESFEAEPEPGEEEEEVGELGAEAARIGAHGLDDLTDGKNDEFTYIY